MCCLTLGGRASVAAAAVDLSAIDTWSERLNESLVDHYAEDELATLPEYPGASFASGRAVLSESPTEAAKPFPQRAGEMRARIQQAMTLELIDAVASGRVEDAKAWRCRLLLPRGVSASDGALLLQSLPAAPAQRQEAARVLARETITWQTTRARQLLDEALRSTSTPAPMPGRLLERLSEAASLADLPAPLRAAAGIDTVTAAVNIDSIASVPWDGTTAAVSQLKVNVERALPSLLTPKERERRERLLYKLLVLIPKEYAAGVRDGQVAVPLEYREAVTFTQQSRQMIGELAPLWMNDSSARASALGKLEALLSAADSAIDRKADKQEVSTAFQSAVKVMEDDLGVTLRRPGTTAEIVEEVMLETRSLLNQSLAAALGGNWAEAEQLRVEAYTTYDPELEARLMPRDPQLALDIERLLLDGIDHPGVKTLLDQHASAAEVEAAYARVAEKMDTASALLKTGIDPRAAAINAGSIVLREGLEGLLVIVAILAGLRGAENAHRRRLIWLGVLAAMGATAVTYILSRTLLTRLHSYAEIIEAITALLAIGVLLLITNWLFHQIYWNQWVSNLKSQAVEGESAWQLMTVGFLIGYREGFETVLFLQSLVMDVGGTPVGIGVAAGLVILFILGFAALGMGLKLPYFKMLMLTAFLIGIVLVAFVGNGVRAMQTVGWLSVHRIFPTSWPPSLGQWFGIYNTWETLLGQLLISIVVIGTWRISRFRVKRAAALRRARREACLTPNCPEKPAIAVADGTIPAVDEGELAVGPANERDLRPCAGDCTTTVPEPISVGLPPGLRVTRPVPARAPIGAQPTAGLEAH